jgi:hypothetical protein
MYIESLREQEPAEQARRRSLRLSGNPSELLPEEIGIADTMLSALERPMREASARRAESYNAPGVGAGAAAPVACSFLPVLGGKYMCSKCHSIINSDGTGHRPYCICLGAIPSEAAVAAPAFRAHASGGSSSFSANYGGAAVAGGVSSSSSSPLARAGELQVFKITPEVGKCYEHIEATRSVYMGGGNRTYFSTNQPVYVGKYLSFLRIGGYGDGAENFAIFQNGEIRMSTDTCFIEVPCKLDQAVHIISEKARDESAAPGTGPANAGIKVPNGAEGGHRRKTQRKQRRQRNQKNRRSRKH